MMRYMTPLGLLRDLRTTNALDQGRFLGLDVGDKYIGVALSDSNRKIATPLSVLMRNKSNIDLVASDFRTLISEFSLVALIVGCPYDRHRIGVEATQVKLLIDDLCKTNKLKGLRYTYWDESFTSRNVDLLLKTLNVHPVESKTFGDKFAAVGILQGYLDFVNRSALDKDIQESAGKS